MYKRMFAVTDRRPYERRKGGGVPAPLCPARKVALSRNRATFCIPEDIQKWISAEGIQVTTNYSGESKTIDNLKSDYDIAPE